MKGKFAWYVVSFILILLCMMTAGTAFAQGEKGNPHRHQSSHDRHTCCSWG